MSTATVRYSQCRVALSALSRARSAGHSRYTPPSSRILHRDTNWISRQIGSYFRYRPPSSRILASHEWYTQILSTPVVDHQLQTFALSLTGLIYPEELLRRSHLVQTPIQPLKPLWVTTITALPSPMSNWSHCGLGVRGCQCITFINLSPLRGWSQNMWPSNAFTQSRSMLGVLHTEFVKNKL